MIPKIIHFVWVGNANKPELVKHCIETWKKFCPDYKIIEWNNDCLQNIDNLYVKQAFQEKKWAFVSDYIRLYAINKFGGFYFDSDLELTNNIDKFRNNKFITGYEIYDGAYFPFTAFMGAEKGSVIIADLLSEYDDLRFINPDGTYNQKTNTVRVSEYFGKKYKLLPPYDGTQITRLNQHGIIYPSYFFCTPEQNKPNYAIHLFNGSWLDGWNRKIKLSFGRLSLVRFKRVRNTQILPIKHNERILCKLHTSVKKFYALIWRLK